MASQDAIRMILAIATSEVIVVEGWYVSNTYLHGDTHIPIIIKQPKKAARLQENPGHVCFLQKVNVRYDEVGEIWGSSLPMVLLNCKFFQSTVDSGVFFKRVDNHFVLLSIFFDDIMLVRESIDFLKYTNEKI